LLVTDAENIKVNLTYMSTQAPIIANQQALSPSAYNALTAKSDEGEKKD